MRVEERLEGRVGHALEVAGQQVSAEKLLQAGAGGGVHLEIVLQDAAQRLGLTAQVLLGSDRRPAGSSFTETFAVAARRSALFVGELLALLQSA